MTAKDGKPVSVAYNCSKDYKVKTLQVHPKYESTEFIPDNDIALLILENEIDLKQPCVCALPLVDEEPSIGDSCIVSGYGSVKKTSGKQNLTNVPNDKEKKLNNKVPNK